MAAHFPRQPFLTCAVNDSHTALLSGHHPLPDLHQRPPLKLYTRPTLTPCPPPSAPGDRHSALLSVWTGPRGSAVTGSALCHRASRPRG